MAATSTLTLTGRLTTPDTFDRIRLLLVDVLEAYNGREDHSHEHLRRSIPQYKDYKVPYRFFTTPDGAYLPDEVGVYGEVLFTIPRTGRATDKATWLVRVAELRNCEVRIQAKVRRYKFVSKAEHNRGKEVSGTSLTIQTLEPLLSGAQ